MICEAVNVFTEELNVLKEVKLVYLTSPIDCTDAENEEVKPFIDCVNILIDALNKFNAVKSLLPADPVIIIKPDPDDIVIFGPAKIVRAPVNSFIVETNLLSPIY